MVFKMVTELSQQSEIPKECESVMEEIFTRCVENAPNFGVRLDCFKESLQKIPSTALVYLDPPYYEKGGELYENHYKKNDHEQISSLVANIRQNWIVSYDNAQPIRNLYSAFRFQTFDPFSACL